MNHQNHPVDVMSLLDRCLGNIGLVTRVLARFRETGSADLKQLEQALERLDFQAAVHVAHRFKGAASNISALRLSALAASAERLGRERNLPEFAEVLAQFRSEWECFVRFAEGFAPPATSSPCGPAAQSH